MESIKYFNKIIGNDFQIWIEFFIVSDMNRLLWISEEMCTNSSILELSLGTNNWITLVSLANKPASEISENTVFYNI